MGQALTDGPRRRKPLRLHWRIAIVAAIFLLCCGSLRRDELECEEAVSYIDHCCTPGNATRGLNCQYVEPSGCCDSESSGDGDGSCGGHNPDINEHQSECVRKFECASLCAALAANITVAELCPP